MSETVLRAYVSVSDMANLLQISRVRFHTLLKKGVFPKPIKIGNSRPYFDESLQLQCLEVKRSNRGIDGRPVLFYQKSAPSNKRSAKPKISKHEFILDGLSALGIVGIGEKEVENAIKTCFPEGICGVCEETVLRLVFVELSNRQPG